VDEHPRADGPGTDHGAGVVERVVVEKSVAAADPLDAFALRLGVEREVVAGIRRTGLRVQVALVDAALECLGIEKDATREPVGVGVEGRDRFRHLPESDEERGTPADCRHVDAADRDARTVGHPKEAGDERAAVARVEERPHLVARQRDEVVDVVERPVLPAPLVAVVDALGRERSPVETTPRTPLAVDLHTRSFAVDPEK